MRQYESKEAWEQARAETAACLVDLSTNELQETATFYGVVWVAAGMSDEELRELLVEGILDADHGKSWLTGDREEFVTCASDRYDGFGTVTVAQLDWDGKPARRVSIVKEHRVWQLNRYSSGMYAAIPAEKFERGVW